MTAVLIVAFARSKKLTHLVSLCLEQNRQIYVFIDGPNDLHQNDQEETVKAAAAFANNVNVKIFLNGSNLGVALAVPEAIDWCMKSEDSIIVLEDDCIPSPFAFDFFDWGVGRIFGNVVLVSGISPESFQDNIGTRKTATLASYPLIWGWACTKESWEKLRETKVNGHSPIRIFKSIVRNPAKFTAIMFFLAATLRVQKGNLKAWDSEVALEMLTSGYKAIIPNHSVIGNTGNDEFASHQMNSHSELPSQVVEYSKQSPSKEIDMSKKSEKITDLLIEKYIYKLKSRHLFSPIKARLENYK